ncbi:MAG: discoidin domain-containing protein, partial [Oceanicoccus sp.]|uniref:discoidin domain-containing protein n=1 Tax=Oceanicoccus sp. TaxID=2691044 RepID=UPI00261777D8
GVIEEQRPDLLNLASGAVMLEYSSEYSGWYALNLLDGGFQHGWASAKNSAFPHRFVIELVETYAIDTLVIDNTGTEERDYPGISAQEINLYAPTEAANTGYGKPLKLTAASGRFTTFKFDSPVEARWLKLVVVSNHGRTDFTEIMGLEAHGNLINFNQLFTDPPGIQLRVLGNIIMDMTNLSFSVIRPLQHD